MSEPQRPQGLTEAEWLAILQHRQRQADMGKLAEWAARIERQSYEAKSSAFDADRAAFTRFAQTLGFVRLDDGRLHANFAAFRSDVPQSHPRRDGGV